MSVKLELLKRNPVELFKKFEEIFMTMIDFRASQYRNSISSQEIYYQQEFIKTYFNSFKAIEELYNGAEVRFRDHFYRINLFSPILILQRNCLENYALFYYIFIDENEQISNELKFQCWLREGYLRRQSFYADNEKHINQKQEEKEMIDEIFNDIKSTDFYNSMKRKDKEKFENYGKWNLLGQSKLLSIAGFGDNFAKNIYNYFSSHTHSTSVGLLQTGLVNKENNFAINESITKPLFMSAGLYLWHYRNLIEELKINKDLWDFVELWKRASEYPT